MGVKYKNMAERYQSNEPLHRLMLASKMLEALTENKFEIKRGRSWQFVCKRNGVKKGSEVIVYTAIEKTSGAISEASTDRIKILRREKIGGKSKFFRIARIKPSGSISEISNIFSKALKKAVGN